MSLARGTFEADAGALERDVATPAHASCGDRPAIFQRTNEDGQASKDRFVFIDALRGVAAIGVVLHHLLHNTVMEQPLRRILPMWMQELASYGANGVQVFFVISGFVIAHSLRSFDFTFKKSAWFILRRQLRLGPPYWVALAFMLVLMGVEQVLPGLQSAEFPSLGAVALNAGYLHNVTGSFQILGVAWTLCLEIQFYTVFIAILCFTRVGKHGASGGGIPLDSLVAVLCSAFISLACFERYVENGEYFPFWSGLFLPYWFYFVSGVLLEWYFRRRIKAFVLVGFLAAFTVATVWHGFPREMTLGFATVMLLYAAGRLAGLHTWLNHCILQYPGRISYSLYLVHLPILSCIMRAGYKITGENSWWAVGWYTAALIASFVGAHLLYRFVEAPCMAMLSRLNKRRSEFRDVLPVERGISIGAGAVHVSLQS